MIEKVMALERQESPGQLAFVANDLGDRDGSVVIGDPNGYGAEEFETGHVGGLKGLCALPRIGGEEIRV